MGKGEVTEVLAEARRALTALREIPVRRMDAPALLDLVADIEHLQRLLPTTQRAALARLEGVGTEAFGGGRINLIVADRLRITPADAARRFREAADLAPRTTITGDHLAPTLPHTAGAERLGEIGAGHITVIRDFHHYLPAAIDAVARDRADAHLADLSTRLRPDEVRRCAHRIAAHLNPDDEFTENDRAGTRYFHLGPQRPDKMRTGSFRVDPELGALLDTLFATLAAPGMCHPDHTTPTVTGTPDPNTTDHRSPGQRRHDALATICRETLAGDKLGTHRGLPVTIIATATLDDLRDKAGHATTSTGALLPIPDLIRMAARTTPYLAIFDNHTARPLYLGRAQRLASPDQRLALYASDRGCTYAGCAVPAAGCEAHHLREWAHGGTTDIDNLTLVCRTHHTLIGTNHTTWRTRRNRAGRTEWTPPHHIDPNGRPRVNSYHHHSTHGNTETHSDNTAAEPSQPP